MPRYKRHRPEQTLLYQLVEEYYPAFEAQWAAEGRVLPDYVRQESEKRLSLTNQGQVRYELKTPYRDGTTHVIFEPVDFIAKLAALVPKPRVNLTRIHGVFAPNSKHRALVTPAKRGRGSKSRLAEGQGEKTPVQRHTAMTWAQRLKRVFNIDVERCRVCGGAAKVIACIEDPVVIKKILTHLEEKSSARSAFVLPDSRAPLQSSLFG